ncbi:MAG: phosphoribosylformylglycinamidine synthase subunit PurQ [Candidatus Omnitrophica bacterium]|nr:phosphoribosylformylglycinamidine synthase subunit PurQ [Candidatus Omnitrophota bacterium]
MKVSVIVFPGSNCDSDCWHVMRDVMKCDVSYVWHKDHDLKNPDLVILPGGFSYGDYLRCGAIARFSPVMKEVVEYARRDGNVLGICNGFQILLEAGLLPGAMLPNRSLKFVCKHVWLRTENTGSTFTNRLKNGQVLRIPIAHGEGNYTASPDTLKELQDQNRIVFRYSSESGQVADEFNPNGAAEHIAGIMNEKGNVLGMMPHPERASEDILGSDDGRAIWESLLSCHSRESGNPATFSHR